MALALYRKYRPRTFAELIGQEHVTEPLSQALRSGRLHHAYLFSGPRGCGKTSSARILARSLNCEQGPTPEPCGVCASCTSLANDGSGSIDVIEIDAASHGGVDDARDLREKAFFAPASSRYKIYVIDEAHMVSPAGFNALLKLVEEPPDYVKFIFATTEPEKVLGTIRSRTHHYPFRLIPPAVLRPYLQQLTEAEGVHVEPAVLPLVVRAGGGSARDTLSVLDQLIAGAGPEGVSYSRAVALLGVTDVALIDEMCDALAAGDGAAAYGTIDRVAEAGHDSRRFASDLLERFRDLIVLQQVPDAVAKGLIDGPADQLDAMTAQSTRLGPATLSRCADIVHNGLIEMRGTTAPRLLLELITARMLLPGAEDSTGALLQRLERMERRLALSADQDPTDSVRPQPAPSGAPQSPAGGGRSAARAAVAAAGRREPEAPAAAPQIRPGSPAGATPAPDSPGAGPTTVDTPSSDELPGAQADENSEDVPASTAHDAGAAGPDAVPSAASSPGADRSGAGQRDDAAPSPGAVRSGAGQREDADGGAAPAGRVEPAGVMPDAPEEPAVDVVPTGRLSAAAIREVWPDIMVAVSRKSKKIAALAQGATVRELEGQTVVLTFRFPAHAKMVAAEPALLSDALYEALGGRWQIRCDVAGEAGPSQGTVVTGRGITAGPARVAPSQAGPDRPEAQSGRPTKDVRAQHTAPAQTTSAQVSAKARREPTPQAAPVDDGDDWPEPARPGGQPTAEATAQPAASADEEWPEPARPGGFAARPGDPTAGPATGGSGAEDPPTTGEPAASGSTSPGSGRSADGPPASAHVDPPSGEVGAGQPGTEVAATHRTPTTPSRGDGPDSGNGPALPGEGGGGGPQLAHSGGGSSPQPGRSAGGSGPAAARAAAGGGPAAARAAAGGGPAAARAAGGGGLAAARAAAANAGRSTSSALVTTQAAPADNAWPDGSPPADEPPYDPEYDGPVRGAPGYEGFDPGDEPLDDVIDEKTARQSSEQQAMQLLQQAFGAEKISEL